jgi:hypothetical protein
MLVIRGRTGKSIVLEKKFQELNQNNILVVDSVGVSHLFPNSFYVRIEKIGDIFGVLAELMKKTIQFNYVIFEINTDPKNIPGINYWEKQVETQFVLTVQDNTIADGAENVQVYEV